MKLETVGCLVLHYQEKMQIHNQRQRTAWGTGKKPDMDFKSTWYMFRRCFIQNNRDSYKEETKIPPPHPQTL